jgi:hypothetical protein
LARGEGEACPRNDGLPATTGATTELPPPPESGLPWLGGKMPWNWKATLTDSTKRPSLFESTCDTANITTKKAKSSVMKSA